MALLSFATLAYAVPLCIFYYAVAYYLGRHRLQRFAKANNATFPKHVSSNIPFGIGFLWRILENGKNGGDLIDDIFEKDYQTNGPTYTMPGFFSRRTLHTVEPANIQAILATKFKDFDLGELRIEQFRPLLGTSIFTADGPFWEHSRAMFRPQFSRDNINDLQKTELAVQSLFKAMQLSGKQSDGAVEIDIMPLLFRFTLDTATGFLFGESVESQMAAATGKTSETSAATAMAADQDDSDMTFAEAFHEAQMWITLRVRFQGLYWLAPVKRGQKAVDYMRKYVSHYVKLALSSAKPSSEKYSLIDALVEQTRDQYELRDQILGLLLAGRDTTATLLSWVLLLIAQHPDVFEKLRESVINDFGPYSDDASHINFATLKDSQYLQFVLRETMRIYNPVPMNLRKAVRDTVLPRGGGPDGLSPIVVPKGQTVNFAPYVLHRRQDIWSSDALEFKPERWEGMRLDWNYIPFSGGPRICIGQQFALTEAAFLLVRLLQKFDKMDWVGRQGKPRKDVHFTMAPRDGVPVKLRYAN
ncbi:Cytochrome P450 52A2 [Colletotrichum truncatum]|uniref:Cytochrome P450 52A2 n=1 Tax=Colletotrichum truncatum TaxID=5467 RepID=A0ACC3Z713_COLTU|nr:Cytochrome P450 52A2 [Colletotrichum truncatum]KAF6785245.1 Cytochrome P450 52A2 [Colletotrichum truncatum]